MKFERYRVRKLRNLDEEGAKEQRAERRKVNHDERINLNRA